MTTRSGSPLGRAARRAISSSTAIRRAVKSPAGQHAVNTVRAARHLHEPLRFARGQLRGSGSGMYRVRSSGQILHLRHRTADIIGFNEVHHFGIYEMPNAVAATVDPPSVRKIVDLGANIGLFTLDCLHRYPAARVTAVEPDPGNAAILRRSITANGFEDRVEVLEACASNAAGSTAFAAGQGIWSRAVEGTRAGTIDVPNLDVLPLLQDADLLKVDIEGGEWAILDDPRFASISPQALALEWHAFGVRAPDLDPGSHAHGRIQGAGLEVIALPPESDCGTVWGYRSG